MVASLRCWRSEDGLAWWILLDVGAGGRCQASHSRLRSHRRAALPDAAQCSGLGSLAFRKESIARCVSYSDTDERFWPSLRHERGHTDDFKVLSAL